MAGVHRVSERLTTSKTMAQLLPSRISTSASKAPCQEENQQKYHPFSPNRKKVIYHDRRTRSGKGIASLNGGGGGKRDSRTKTSPAEQDSTQIRHARSEASKSENTFADATPVKIRCASTTPKNGEAKARLGVRVLLSRSLRKTEPPKGTQGQRWTARGGGRKVET